VKALVRLVPVVFIAVIAIIEISAAIKPYSIAVAPDSSFQTFLIVANMILLLGDYFEMF